MRRSRRRPVGGRLPLASLQSAFDDTVPHSEWTVDPDGLLGRALAMPVGGRVTYLLALTQAVQLTATALLSPHDWRDRAGAVRVGISVTNATGRRELWARTLRAGDRGPAGGRHLNVTVPADATALHLAVDGLRNPPPHAVRSGLWLEPALWDPDWPARAGVAAPSRAPTRATERSASDPPLFSVLVPVHDPSPWMLTEAIGSVQQQTFGDWELRLVDDGCTDPAVLAVLEREQDADPRIHLHRHAGSRGISAATNTALAHATGTYIALLDHDDTLAPDALARIADAIASDPTLDMLYTDEDVIGDGVVLEAHPKPGWSPDQMTAAMYTCHLGVYRRSLVHEIGGFHSRFDGCQDFDLVLRLTERSDRIAHVPGVLYHWRAHAGSTATIGGDAKPEALLRQPRAIGEHLERSGIEAEVRFGSLPGLHRIVHRVDPSTAVAIVLAIQSLDGLWIAGQTWAAQAHGGWHVTIAAPAHLTDLVRRTLTNAGIVSDHITVVTTAAPPTAALHEAARHAAAGADELLLLQTPAAGLTRDWLTRLIGYSRQPAIAAAGPILLTPDGRVSNAGVALPDGIPLHLLHGERSSQEDHFGYAASVRNVSALSGAAMTSAELYTRLGGLDADLRGLALVDYCLRARAEGGRVVAVPDSRMRIVAQSALEINDLPALRALRTRWSADRDLEPYYNVGYHSDRGDVVIRRPAATPAPSAAPR